jgi:hypothetical protein
LPPLAGGAIVEYRIAYLALCIETSSPGRHFLKRLTEIPAVDPDYVQFGSADWFWKNQVNSFVLQVEPLRHSTKDRIFISVEEARHLQCIRGRFYQALRVVIREEFHGEPPRS